MLFAVLTIADVVSGQMEHIYKGSKELPTLKDAIDPTKNKDAKRMYGATGGFQPTEGTFFGTKYKPGSLWDRLTEGYAGTHDYTAQFLGFYDKYGNTTRHRNKVTIYTAEGAATIAIPLVTPFALPDILSEDDWTGLYILGQ